MMRTARALVWALALAISALPQARAQSWPDRPVKIIVTFGAGGTADILGRIVAAELSQEYRQQFYVENKVGGGGIVGSTEAFKAEPDGYTLMIAGAGPQLVNPALNPNVTYQTMRDFTHIAMIAGDSYILAVSPSLGVKTFKEFLAATRDKPSIACGSPGAGTQGELLQHIINAKTGSKLQPIAFRSAADAVTALFGDHILAAMQPSISLGEYVKANKVVGLAVTSKERIAAYPDIPTLSELGYDVEGGASWFWLAGPSKLPADIVAKLNASVRRIVSSDRIREQFAKSALITADLDQKATTSFIADEVKLWARVAKENPLPKQP